MIITNLVQYWLSIENIRSISTMGSKSASMILVNKNPLNEALLANDWSGQAIGASLVLTSFPPQLGKVSSSPWILTYEKK